MINGKKVVSLIQARCTSTRLPKKHFRYIGDKMLIDWVVDRLKSFDQIDEIVISATNDVSDDPLKKYAEKNNVGFYGFDGDVNDVVSRHYNAVKAIEADYVVVISGDCPLVDCALINTQLQLLDKGYDYCRPARPCIHEGIDSYSSKCIRFINENSKTSYERENFGIIIRDNPKLFNVGFFDVEEKYLKNEFRISVDNMADLKFMNKTFATIKNKNEEFNLENVIDMVKKHKNLLDENSHVQQKKKGEKTYKFLIKTEASEEKGLGHIKRMMALGQFLNENKNNGVRYAINKDKISQSILENNGYLFDYNYVEDEVELIALIKKYEPDFLIIDVQRIEGSNNYNFENIKKQTGIKKIILIDKYIENEFVDLMIIQGIQSDDFEEKVCSNHKVLYGLKTVFINNDFRKVRREVKNQIVISFGGTDINNLTTKIIKLLNNMKINMDYTYKIILGPYFKHTIELKEILSEFKYQYKIITNPNNMAEEIKDCKLGIIFYGVSFYEFKFLEIPTIDIVSDEIYETEFEKLVKMGLANYCGTKDKLDYKKINKYINNIPTDYHINFKIGDLEYIYDKITEVL